MAKQANRYLEIDPYKIEELSLHKDRTKVSESLFSLSNEYQGIRGYFEEGGELPSLQGVYFNGIYAKEKTNGQGYKGIVDETHFMLNSLDWVKIKLEIDGVKLDLKDADITSFKRSISFDEGILYRSFIWHLNDKEITLSFERMLSMTHCKRGYQKIAIKTSKDIHVSLSFYLSGNIKQGNGKNYYIETGSTDDSLLLHTLSTDQKVCSVMQIVSNEKLSTSKNIDKEVENNYTFTLKEGDSTSFIRYIVNDIDRSDLISDEQLSIRAREELEESLKEGYDKAKEDQRDYWSDFFNKHDITIEGDPLDQQGIRYCLFQLQQTYHGLSGFDNIGAKGLTGESYNGHAFWDSETYCLTYYLLNNIEGAKKLLMYRYNTLPQAKKRAKMLDCSGACYPIATLNGDEACALWQHASCQFQPSTGVFYGIYHYMTLTDDTEFLHKYGLEMLLEISKFLLSRGDYDSTGKKFGFYCVMGPDEFQMMVNNNTYTNYMAKKTFEYTIECINSTPKEIKEVLFKKTETGESFIKDIQKAAESMIILKDEKTEIYEQHDGFFKLPHIDVNTIPVTDFPLYNHWSYDRIYRNDIIKQPDVLMMMYLFNSSFSRDEKITNYNYYAPRCIHESSLSPSVHSILACEIDEMDEALSLFGFATRLDLDDYNRNTDEGLHTTSISAAYLNIVYGFGGVRSDGKILKIDPKIPPLWKSYSFSLTYHSSIFKVEVSQIGFSIFLISGNPQRIDIKGKTVLIEDRYETKYEK